MPSARLELHRTSEGDTTVLALVGELDAHTCADFDAALAGEADEDEVVLDLSEVRFVDSLGLRAIVAEHNSRSEHQRRLRLRNLQESVARTFEYAGLRDHLLIDP